MTRNVFFNLILMSQKPILTYGVACLEILSCILICRLFYQIYIRYYKTYDLFKRNSKKPEIDKLSKFQILFGFNVFFYVSHGTNGSHFFSN